MWKQIPCSIYRGGTSKAIFFFKEDLPTDPIVRDQLLLSIVGDPDPERLNGLGGTTLHSSKIVIINKSDHENMDVDYIHGQVGLTESVIDYTSNGGNIAFAVGLFALNKGLSHLENNQFKVRIFAENTEDRITVHFPGLSRVDHDTSSQMKGIGSAKINLEFSSPGGGVTGTLFPTGSPMDRVEIEGKPYRITIIDAGNLTAQVYAAEIGLSGTEIDESDFKKVMPLIDKIHKAVREKLGLKSPALPKIMIVNEPSNYVDRNGEMISKEQITLCARDITWGKLLHTSFPITGTVAFAVSCRVPGTIANTYADSKEGERILKIGHPSGILEVDAVVLQNETGWEAQKIIVGGSATALLDGNAWVSE